MKTLVLALAAIIDKGEILLLKRNKDPYLGYWGLPGGKIDFGEHVRNAAIREALEETGMNMKYEGVICAATEVIFVADEVTGLPAKEAHFAIFVSKMSPIDLDFKAGSEGELDWVKIDDFLAADDEGDGIYEEYVKAAMGCSKKWQYAEDDSRVVFGRMRMPKFIEDRVLNRPKTHKKFIQSDRIMLAAGLSSRQMPVLEFTVERKGQDFKLVK